MEMPSGSNDGNNIPSILFESVYPDILHHPPESIFDHYMGVFSTFFSFASHHPRPLST